MRTKRYVSITNKNTNSQFIFIYFCFQGLIEEIKAVSNKKKEEEELDTELTRIDIIKCIQSEKVRFRGVNLSGLDLSKLVGVFQSWYSTYEFAQVCPQEFVYSWNCGNFFADVLV